MNKFINNFSHNKMVLIVIYLYAFLCLLLNIKKVVGKFINKKL
jgi:hypothetical protein